MTSIDVSKCGSSQLRSGASATAQERGAEVCRVHYSRPRYRVQEFDTDYKLAVDLPGVSKEDVELSAADGVLDIAATRSWSGREEWTAVSGIAEESVAYRLRLSLSDELDVDQISANLEDGVLHVTLVKAEEKKPRRIDVK